MRDSPEKYQFFEGTDLHVQELEPSEWNAVSQAFSDLTFEQCKTYADAAAGRIGAHNIFIAVLMSDAIVAAAVVRIKLLPGLNRGIALVPSGPLTERRDSHNLSPLELTAVFAAMRSYILNKGHILRVRLPVTTPYDNAIVDSAVALAGFFPCSRMEEHRTVLMDLQAGEESSMSNLHGKWRAELRKSLRADLSIESGPIANLANRFDALYRQVREDKGFSSDIPPEFYYTLEGMDFDHRVLIAKKDGHDLAAITVGFTGNNSVYLFGATASEGRKVSAGYYLTWAAMNMAREIGCRWYDLGGIDAVRSPSVARFKLRTGGREVLAPGPYEAHPSDFFRMIILMTEVIYKKLSRFG